MSEEFLHVLYVDIDFTNSRLEFSTLYFHHHKTNHI